MPPDSQPCVLLVKTFEASEVGGTETDAGTSPGVIIMSASNSQQILEKTEPSRGVKPIKPPIKPKPVLPPRPKEISASGAENKSPLLSPTCVPSSPTSDIPSALKISQLTGPQPYGTRRTSLKRWSSSVGEDPENNVLSPVENRSPEVPAKMAAQPLSAPVRPLHTGPAWKGKSPFMLTTRGWGEQRMSLSRDHNDSESSSQKASVLSKDTDVQKRETTTIEEGSRSPSRFIPEEEPITHVQDSIARLEALSPRASENVKVVSPGFGSSRSAQIKDYEKHSSAPFQSDPQTSQYDHKEDVLVPSIGSRVEKKAPSVPIRGSAHVPKIQTEVEHVQDTIAYDHQIPDLGSRPEHKLLSDDLIVKPYDPQNVDDATPQKYTQHIDTAQPSHHDRDKQVTPKPPPPKPKERKKPSVQFILPKEEDQDGGQSSMDWTASTPEGRETTEHGHKEDVRKWDREDGREEKPSLHRQQKTEEEKKPSAGSEEPPALMRTPISDYTMTTDDGISRDNTDDGPSEVQGSHFHHVDIKEEKETRPIPHTTELYENVEFGNQRVDTIQPEDTEDRILDQRWTEVEAGVKNVGYVPHFSHTPSDSSPAPRSEHGFEDDPALDSGTPYIHHQESREHYSEVLEATDRKEPEHVSAESHDKLQSQEIYTLIYSHSEEFHPPSAPAEPQEDLTQKIYEPKSSRSQPGYYEDSEFSTSEEFHLSNSEEPTHRTTELSDQREHKDGVQYYSTYSQDVEKPRHGGDESEEHQHSHSHVEEPLPEHVQFEHQVHTQTTSEELIHTNVQSEEPMQEYSHSGQEGYTYEVSKEASYGYGDPEKLVYTYTQPEEPDQHNIEAGEESHGDVVLQKVRYGYDEQVKLAYTYKQPEELDHQNRESEEESHRDVVLKKAKHGFDEPVKVAYTYRPPEEPDQHNIDACEESHGDVVLQKVRYGNDEPVKLAYTYRQPEEPVPHNIEAGEESHGDVEQKKAEYGYDEPIKSAYTYRQPEESVHQNIETGEVSHGDVVLQKARYGYDEPVKLAHMYKREDPDHQNRESEEESHRNVVLQKVRHGYDEPVKLAYTFRQPEESDLQKEKNVYDQPEKLHHRYDQPEESIHHNIHSEELAHSHEPSQTPTPTYDQQEHNNYTYSQLNESYSLDTKTKRPEEAYEHGEETSVKLSQPEDLPEVITAHVKPDDSYYQQTQQEEPLSRDYQSKYHQSPSEEPHYQQNQSERPYYYQQNQSEGQYHLKNHTEESHYQHEQPEEPNYHKEDLEESYYHHKHSDELHYRQEQSNVSHYQQDESEGQNYQQKHSEEPTYQPAQSERPYYQQDISQETDYQQHQSEEQHYQQKHLEESHHKHSDELHHQQTQSEASDFRNAQPEHLIRHHSDHGDVQTSEGNIKMIGDDSDKLDHGYIDLHAVETDSGHATSAEHKKAENRPETDLDQQHRESSLEESHHREDLTSEGYHEELLSTEEDLRYTQQEEPNTLDTHTVEPNVREDLVGHHEDTDSTVTDGQSNSEESQDARPEDGLKKQSYTEETVNGHYEPEESEFGKVRSDGPKESEEIDVENGGETVSDAEETPEDIKFDFLEGTTVLDTSLMRCRASLGRKRNHRTPATGICTAEEEANPEYWMFRDSTEPKCPPEKEPEDEKEEATSPECTPENSPTSVKSPSKKGGIFSGIISPSLLKGRLKTRSKTTEDETSKTESKESQDPTSPGKDKSESSSHSLNWLQALKKKKKKNPK